MVSRTIFIKTNNFRRIRRALLAYVRRGGLALKGLIPINIKIEETGKYYEITKEKGMHYDREMEVKNQSQPAKHVKIIEGRENSPHFIQVYTDGSKNDTRVGSGITIFSENNLMATLK